MGFSSEIYLTQDNINKEEWHSFIEKVSNYNGILNKWSLTIFIINNKIHYIVDTKVKLPLNIDNLKQFILKRTNQLSINNYYLSLPTYLPITSNLPEIINYCNIKNYGKLKYIKIIFRRLTKDKILSKTYLYLEKDNTLIKTKLLLSIPESLLSIDYSSNKYLSYQKIPKYLDISKLLPILSKDNINSIFSVDPFPYLDDNLYLNQNTYDFAKHSLVLGSSGTGKSKFISSLIKNIKDNHSSKYKVVLIDPHASIETDIRNISNIINFKELQSSINLFSSNTNDLIANTELTLSLFKSIITSQYNSKLERVLRHSIYLLLHIKDFNFNTLNQLISDITYRNKLLKDDTLPPSTKNFFLTDFNEIRTKYYSEAISPIIAFIDEMMMLQVFNNTSISSNLLDTINNNNISIFSLDRTFLGDKITKTISGLIMQQLFTIICSHSIKEHLIFVIDEVSIIENPIINRFLSEARKYNVSLIIASQYFNQISVPLQDAIFSNVINYYIFRTSTKDATILSENLDIKIPSDKGKNSTEIKENKINLLSNLNNRECLLRLSQNNKLLPVFKAHTLDFKINPSIPKNSTYQKNINASHHSNDVPSFVIFENSIDNHFKKYKNRNGEIQL